MAGTDAQTCPGLQGRQVPRGMGERVPWAGGPTSGRGQGAGAGGRLRLNGVLLLLRSVMRDKALLSETTFSKASGGTSHVRPQGRGYCGRRAGGSWREGGRGRS